MCKSKQLITKQIKLFYKKNSLKIFYLIQKIFVGCLVFYKEKIKELAKRCFYWFFFQNIFFFLRFFFEFSIEIILVKKFPYFFIYFCQKKK